MAATLDSQTRIGFLPILPIVLRQPFQIAVSSWCGITVWAWLVVCVMSTGPLALGQDVAQGVKSKPVALGNLVEPVEGNPEGVLPSEADSEQEIAGPFENQAVTTTSGGLRVRLICFAFFGGLLLVFLSVLFGYLRLDHATRGFHSGRLQLSALVFGAIVLAVGYLLWTHVLFK